MAEEPRLHESWEPIVERHARETPETVSRETVQEAVRVEIERAKRQAAAPPPGPVPSAPAQQMPHPKEQEFRNLEDSRQLVFLARMALHEGVEPAVRLAEKVGTPYVIDALHDYLVDRLLAVIAERRAARNAP